jgi:C-terminal processing protease CtpA/Prc
MCSKKDSEVVVVKTANTNSTPRAAGIGAVFGVDATGAVFFNASVPGSSCDDAVRSSMLQTGDILYSVDDDKVYRAKLSTIARKLLGPPGSMAKVTFVRGEERISLQLERRIMDMNIARQAVSDAQKSDFGASGGNGR